MSTRTTRLAAIIKIAGQRNPQGRVKKLVLLLWLVASSSGAGVLIETNIPSREGFEKGWFVAHTFTRTVSGLGPQTSQINTIYIPRTGMAWTGDWGEQFPSIVEGRIISVYPLLGGEVKTLYFSTSTNKYPLGLTNVSAITQPELSAYTNTTRRYQGQQYCVRLEKLLGSVTLRDYESTNLFFDLTFKNVTRPTKLGGMLVEGTNAVVSLEIGTNILARIAFNKHVIPVWATTNGVSIGPIPTNCVFYSDIVSNKVVTRVVY